MCLDLNTHWIWTIPLGLDSPTGSEQSHWIWTIPLGIDLTKTQNWISTTAKVPTTYTKRNVFTSDENVLKNILVCDDAFDDGAGATDDSGDDTTCRLLMCP